MAKNPHAQCEQRMGDREASWKEAYQKLERDFVNYVRKAENDKAELEAERFNLRQAMGIARARLLQAGAMTPGLLRVISLAMKVADAQVEAMLKDLKAYRARWRERQVTPEEIRQQRESNWPDFHPERYCHSCGRRNIWSWHVDSELWNKAIGNPDGILCPVCFVDSAEKAGIAGHWKLVLDVPAQPAENPKELVSSGVS
jgi:hypothetical protein